MQSITLLGATGSIGVSTLDVVARHPDRYRIFALTAHTRVAELAAQCAQFRPAFAVVANAAAAEELSALLSNTGLPTEVVYGEQALCDVASDPECTTVMAAIVGAAGLRPTLAAARAGKKVLLANKEALVMSGALFMDAVAASGATLLPIDSEHNAIFQCLPLGYQRAPQAHGIRKILLTASGGPFLDRDVATLDEVTPEQAVAHPNWSMGRKISVDSATMMNKGLEVIEAKLLFGLPSEQVEIVVHPQSVIHSMVAYRDGSVLAQLGTPDMRIPIAHALGWPARMDSPAARLDFHALSALTFERPDSGRFPSLRLAREALATGGVAPIILNAANEAAVAAFLARRIGFLDIARVVEDVLDGWTDAGQPVAGLEEVHAADVEARARAETVCEKNRLSV